jgi:hypothetical protein
MPAAACSSPDAAPAIAVHVAGITPRLVALAVVPAAQGAPRASAVMRGAFALARGTPGPGPQIPPAFSVLRS